MKKPKMMTADVARRLNLTPRSVHELERKGHLAAERTQGGARLFNAEDVDRLAKERAANKKKGR